jgi:hypothetical protein
MGMRIPKGHFNRTNLDGLRFFVVALLARPAARRQGRRG